MKRCSDMMLQYSENNVVGNVRPYDSVDFRSGFTAGKDAVQWLPYSCAASCFKIKPN